MRHYTKFRCDRSNGDFSTFSKWRPSAILESSYAYLDHPRRVFCGLITCTKLGWNRCSSFDNRQFLILHALEGLFTSDVVRCVASDFNVNRIKFLVSKVARKRIIRILFLKNRHVFNVFSSTLLSNNRICYSLLISSF